ncbi:MAG: hypothetical protein MHM6MM_006923 [Cercozoa sp. M6MM]
MPNFSVDAIRRLMDNKDQIRNMSVIAHVDHGKSTLTDALISKAGIIADAVAGEKRFMDTRDDEQARSITIKSTSVSLFYEKKEEDGTVSPFLINLIDSPGHVDFSSEVTAALRVTDGALVVVDCIEGVSVQTETVLRQAISERIKPVLFVNKLDRVFLELHMDPEEAYANFRQAVESANVVIATYQEEKMGDLQVTPENGSVGFGSGLHAWGFTLKTFASMYAKKFGVPVEKLMKKFWGDNFFFAKTGKWSRRANKDGQTGVRGFIKFITEPINTMVQAIMQEKSNIYEPMFEKLNITVPKDAVDLRGKPLLKAVMRTWLPAGDALLDMIVTHLPSPATAQKYRAELLYTGPHDDECFQAIKNCDSQGPLMMYVSKMVPTSEKGRFYAFGRVFAGTIAAGRPVRIYGPEYVHGGKKDLYENKKVQRTMLMMGRYVESLPDCPSGNVVGLVGVDNYLLKCGTVTDHAEAFPLQTMKFSVSAVVRVAVEPKNASDLPKLLEGLKRLSKSDPLVQISVAKTGEQIIAGAGELHLEVCLKDLKEQFMRGAAVNVSDPVVNYAETMLEESSQQVTTKSPNKHNKIWLGALPLGEELTDAIENGDITENDDVKERSRLLADKYDWDVATARKIWSFGCAPDAKANLLVNVAQGAQYLLEIKDHMVSAFTQATAGGVLADEVMRGGRFEVHDCSLHTDAVHRGAGQIMPAAKKGYFGCQLVSGPALMEPMYLVDITVPQHSVAGVYNTLSQRRGIVEDKVDRIGTPLCQVKAFLPVMESFGFTALLRKNTSGQAFPQMRFSHWQAVSGNPLDEDSSAGKLVLSIRERKGLKVVLPDLKDYYDKF